MPPPMMAIAGCFAARAALGRASAAAASEAPLRNRRRPRCPARHSRTVATETCCCRAMKWSLAIRWMACSKRDRGISVFPPDATLVGREQAGNTTPYDLHMFPEKIDVFRVGERRADGLHLRFDLVEPAEHLPQRLGAL